MGRNGRSLLLPPKPAIAAGFTNLAFYDDFTSTGNIDLLATNNPGFLWYPTQWFSNGSIHTTSDNFSQSGSVLTIGGGTPTASTVPGVVSAFETGLGTFVGHVFGNGGYFEVCMAFNHTNTVPAFYGMSIEHIYDNNSVGDGHWPGQAANYAHFIEVDIYDSLNDPTYYQSAIHDWSGVYTGSAYPGNIQNGASLYRFTGGIDWTKMHTFAYLWTKQQGSTPGCLTPYFDGVPASTQPIYYLGPPGSPPLPSDGGLGTQWDPNTPAQADRTYSVIDGHRLALRLEAQTGLLRVDWVKVWTP